MKMQHGHFFARIVSHILVRWEDKYEFLGLLNYI